LTILGAGASTTIIDGGGIDRVFSLHAGSLTAKDLTVRNGAGQSFGGGFYVVAEATLTLERVAVTGNTAGAGGGIFNWGTLTIKESVIYGNSATDANGGWCFGGGLYVWSGTANLTNVTVSTNTANCPGGGIGAGIIMQEGSSSYLINCTIANNIGAVGASGHGLCGNGSPTVDILNTIVANNTGENCYQMSSKNGYYNSTDNPVGYNISSDSTCGFWWPGDMRNTDPLLGPLQDNGGPTWTHALLPGSPAIDTGTATNAPAIDQRGVSRPQGAGIDIGAFESYPAATIAKAFLPTTIPLYGISTLTFTIANSNLFALTGVAFTDNFPAGLLVATPPNAVNNCGGLFTATAGGSSVGLSGGTVASSSNCTISVAVYGATLGVKSNTTGAISTSNAGTGTTSNTASLTVADLFDVCLKDSLTGNIFQLSTSTGSYMFTQCSSSTTLRGTATMTPQNQCQLLFMEMAPPRVIKGYVNQCTNTGTVGISSPPFGNIVVSSPQALSPCGCAPVPEVSGGEPPAGVLGDESGADSRPEKSRKRR
jgi:hypothetical protein